MPPKPTRGAARGGGAAKGRGAAAPAARGGATRGRGGGAGRGKPAGAAKGGKPEPKPTEPPKKVWTPQDEAASKIQRCVRGFLAQRALMRKRKEKEQYEAEMARLEKEAVLAIVRRQQEEAEKQRKKEEEEKRLRIEHNKRKKRMLEAAFDGDDNEILAILKEVDDLDTKIGLGNDIIGRNIRARHQLDMVDCEDAHKNTPLSEAASGGQTETARMLMNKGANVNSQGQFSRTPLYRAAFAGHLETCELLLESGADPRIYAEDAQSPVDVSANNTIKELFVNWDMSRTEVLLEKIVKEKERRAEEDQKRREAEIGKIENRLESCQKDFDAKKKRLNKAYEELNKRIYEHDHAAASGFERPEITENAIHDAEMELEVAKIDFDKSREQLSQVKLELREKKKEEATSEEASDRPGVQCVVRELDDVLLRDVGNRIRDSGKCPIIVDPTGQAATFLRYRDTNYLNALSPHQMAPDKVRLALLGALRYGKPLVLDTMEVDMFETCKDRFNEIKKGLMEMILDRSIQKEENYLSLVKKEDGQEYDKNKFMPSRVERFMFFLITKNSFPPDELLEIFFPIWVIVAEP